MDRYFAHSANAVGGWHLLREHLSAVGELAAEFAGSSRWREEVRLAGRLHDLGKYGDRFQARLRGEESGLDHWSAGARMALEQRAAAAALAIEGHHIGLQSLSRDSLGRLPNPCVPGLRLTADMATLKERLAQGAPVRLPRRLPGAVEGDALVLGIRPEHVFLAAEAGGAPGAASDPGVGLGAVTVDLIEHLGGETLVYARAADGQRLTLSLDGQQAVAPGATVAARLDPSHAHVFDREGRAL